MFSIPTVLVAIVLVTVGVTLASPLRDRLGTGGGNSIDWTWFDGLAQVTDYNDNVQFRKSFGQFDVEHDVPMYHDAQFPIASNTKLITAVMIYQLQERGILNVTQDISWYLNATDFAKMGHPDMEYYCPKMQNSNSTTNSTTGCQTITLRHLLSMSSGIYGTLRCSPRFPQMAEYCAKYNYILYPGSFAAMVGTFIADPLEFVPGTSYSYSNANFILAGYIIEKYSGMRYGDYLKKFITEPLGMKNTRFDSNNGQFALNAQRVGEYHRFVNSADGSLLGTGVNTVDFDMGSIGAAGGVWSTQDDERIFYRTLFNFTSNGAPLLSDPQSLKDIIAPWTKIIPSAYVPTFFAQGVIIVCKHDDPTCATDGVQFVIYQGGTLCVHTVNIYDIRPDPTRGGSNLRRNQLTQVWQSSMAYNVTKEIDEAAVNGPGQFFYTVAMWPQWVAPTMERGWMLQALYGPPPS